MRLPIFILFQFIFCLASSCFGQKSGLYKLPRRETVSVNQKEQLLKVQVLRKEKKQPNLHNDRQYTWIKAHIIHSTQGGFEGKLLDGQFTAFYLDYQLKEKGIFKSGLKAGTWKGWDKNGRLIHTTTWKKGRRSGKTIIYSETGVPLKILKYKKGLLHGRQIHYSGDSAVVTKYSRNELQENKRKKQPSIKEKSDSLKEKITPPPPQAKEADKIRTPKRKAVKKQETSTQEKKVKRSTRQKQSPETRNREEQKEAGRSSNGRKVREQNQ